MNKLLINYEETMKKVKDVSEKIHTGQGNDGVLFMSF